MDTEEHLAIEKARRLGHPQTDEGPYYHHSWWESYKGSVKGKMGGAVIGAALGAVAGVTAAIAIPLVGGVLLTTGALAATVAGFSAAGMLYGAHEFADVGRITGAVAAAHDHAEERMKNYEDKKFAEIENKIDRLQATVDGKPLPEDKTAALENELIPQEGLDYKTKHCDEEHCFTTQEKPRLIFWKVALIGLAIGAVAGALLATGGLAGHALAALGIAGEGGVLSTTGVFAASTLTMGLFGASFGVNRDLFRHVFDKTDLMFRGILGKEKETSPTVIAPSHIPDAPQKTVEKAEEKAEKVVYEGQVDYPESKTYHRDKVMASAQKALLSLDHTKAIPH